MKKQNIKPGFLAVLIILLILLIGMWIHASHPASDSIQSSTNIASSAHNSTVRAEHTSLSFYQNGTDTTADATLYEEDGYSIYIVDEGWEFHTDLLDSYTAAIWNSVENNNVKLSIITLDACTLSEAQAWIQKQFSVYELLEDSRGGLGGTNAENIMLDVSFYIANGVVYALLQQYPLEQAETFSTYLNVMADTFALAESQNAETVS